MKFMFALISLATLALPMTASAEKWLKVMPDDPYGKEGTFHMFDIDSGFEDEATGLVAARLIYKNPETVAKEGVTTWNVWAFDCGTNTFYWVYDVMSGVTKMKEGWRNNPVSLKEPHMDGVTNVFAKKLCALKGSWPKGKLP